MSYNAKTHTSNVMFSIVSNVDMRIMFVSDLEVLPLSHLMAEKGT